MRDSSFDNSKTRQVALIAVLFAAEAAVASSLTVDAVQKSTAIAVRVVAPPTHVKLPSGIAFGLAACALCLLVMRPNAAQSPKHEINQAPFGLLGFECFQFSQRRHLRAARSGGSRDR